MRENRAIQAVAGLTTLLAGGALLFSLAQWPPRVDPGPPTAVGQMLARETLSRLQPGGEITVITRDTGDFKQPALDLLLAAFTRAVRQGKASIATIRALEVDPLRLVEVPSGDFVSLLRRAPPGSVIVSLMGPPLLMPDDRRAMGAIQARVVAFCPGALPAQIDLRQLFAEGLLDAAVVSRPDAPAGAQPPGRGAFDRWYQTITATNVGRLYTQLRS